MLITIQRGKGDSDFQVNLITNEFEEAHLMEVAKQRSESFEVYEERVKLVLLAETMVSIAKSTKSENKPADILQMMLSGMVEEYEKLRDENNN